METTEPDGAEARRDALLDRLPHHAAFDGWGRKALRAAAADLGLSAEEAASLVPGGPGALIAAWCAKTDRAMAAALASDAFRALPRGERIRAAIETRLALQQPHKEAVRRMMATLALPPYALRAPRILWRTAGAIADAIAAPADDTTASTAECSTDRARQRRRAAIAAAHAAALCYWLGDDSEDGADTKAFLARRLQRGMAMHERRQHWRATCRNRPGITRFLDHLRHRAA